MKRRPDGHVDRYKARLVAKGYEQKHGVNYQETFSPVVKFDSLRMILAIAAAEDMKLHQFDVKTAFLYGNLEENILMKQPEGCDDGTGRVCKLNKSLYGLKQASRCWNERFTNFLRDNNFKKINSDPCVFINNGKETLTILAIYIDDGLLATKDEKLAKKLFQKLGKEFEIVIGNAKFFLGFQIDKQIDGSIIMHQTSYANQLLKRFNMKDANPVTIPADKNHNLNPNLHPNSQLAQGVPYREAVGSLMYLAVGTRPDVAYALSTVSQFLSNPYKIHWEAVKRILKYLKGTANYGIKFVKQNDLSLIGYSDSDYAGDSINRRSTSGYLYKLGESPIAWNTKRQSVVALSTTEAEFIAAANAIKEMIWLNRLKREVLCENKQKPKLLMDNQSAIRLLKNPEFNKRSKHIDIKYHFAREKYQKNLFDLEYVKSSDQEADVFTKPLPREQFWNLCNKIGLSKIKDNHAK